MKSVIEDLLFVAHCVASAALLPATFILIVLDGCQFTINNPLSQIQIFAFGNLRGYIALVAVWLALTIYFLCICPIPDEIKTNLEEIS